MNEMMLLEAIGAIDDAYIAAVWQRLDSSAETFPEIPRETTDMPSGEPDKSSGKTVLHGHSHNGSRSGPGRTRRISHRLSFIAAAVLLLLMSVFTMAMAFSEDFRSAVFRFLRISGSDVVLPAEDEPDWSDSIEIIGETSVEDALSVQYIRINGIYTCGEGGAIYLYDEQTREETAAYTVENGELHRLTPHRDSLEYTWNGIAYSIDFVWYDDGDRIYVNSSGYDSEHAAGWSVQAVSGSDCLAAITLSQGAQIDYQVYPLLYDLRRQQLQDPVAQCEALKSRPMTWTAFSENAVLLLIDCDYLDSDLYCLDPASHTLYSLDQLSGMRVLGAWFLDSKTICCVSEDQDGNNTCRTLTLAPSGDDNEYAGETSGENPSDDSSYGGICSEIFSSLPGLESSAGRGIQFTGGRYGLLVEENGETWVMDLKTGQKAIIENFTYPSEEVFTTRNSAGDKILFVRRDSSSAGSGLAVSEMGILSLNEYSFTVFSREGYETRYEGSVSWFDNDRILIEAVSGQDNYLYIFTLK